ncbi:MAG: UDP-N-acetylmuramate--L-alanine ligase [Nocardioidaceae bacterium]
MRLPVASHIMAAEELGAVHFVGIGGAALSGLARLMVARGIRVSGSDAQDSPLLHSLTALGVACFVGHHASQVRGADTVVVSAAVGADNPEVVQALADSLRVWPRSAAVQSLLLGHRAVVVTGTHGKTTTTSMLVTALLAAGADPSYAIGSTLTSSGLNAAAGSDPLFVAEGDESDAAILVYSPYGAVVTNVDVDHLDFFGSARAYAEVFDAFLLRVEDGGFCVCGVDDPGGRRLAGRSLDVGLRTTTVGTSSAATMRAVDIRSGEQGSTSSLLLDGRPMGELTLRVPGPVYVVDAVAALAAGLELGYGFDDLARGLASFRGSSRRMESKGTRGGIRVYDSYAHHPAEIQADLRAARALAGRSRVVVCFQPHLFSRTHVLGAEMGVELAAADVTVVMDVYAAREGPKDGISGAIVADAAAAAGGEVVYEPARSRVVDRLVDLTRQGDLLLTLGAGDVTDIGPLVLARLGELRQKEQG